MSKLYKGIIFNSTTVRALRGQLADTVRERRIRTAVVSNHGKTEVQEALDDAGVTVDVIVGGYDLSRWGKYRKPKPDLLFVAAAKMGLEMTDIISVVDCHRDSTASAAAGMDTVEYDPTGMESLIPMLGVGRCSLQMVVFGHNLFVCGVVFQGGRRKKRLPLRYI